MQILEISDEAMAYAKDFMKHFKVKCHYKKQAAMSVGVAADGGYTVPETFQNTVLMKLYSFSKTEAFQVQLEQHH